MPVRSPEIEQALRDVVDAMARSDLDEVGRRTSRDPSAVAIGTDPSEWGEGFDEIMRLFGASTPEGGSSVSVSVDELAAFREGSVGWAACRASFEIEGRKVPVRLTAVLLEEDGEWKAVQSHASIGVPNDQMLDPMFQGA
jgi:ketosteroid isomerase-like protein